MLNGRKNAAIGLAGLITFILLEIGAALGVVVLGIELIFDPDWPFLNPNG